MKKFLVCVFLPLVSFSVNAFDKEAICRSRIEGDKNRAAWGISMRQEMLKKCKTSLDVCAKPYLKKINEVKQKDDLELIDFFSRTGNVEQSVRISMLTDNISMQTAALIGFKEDGKTPNEVALENYNACLSSR